MERKTGEQEEVISATECTGLAPALAENPEQAEAIEELYAVTPQKSGDQKPHGRSPIRPQKERDSRSHP